MVCSFSLVLRSQRLKMLRQYIYRGDFEDEAKGVCYHNYLVFLSELAFESQCHIFRTVHDDA